MGIKVEFDGETAIVRDVEYVRNPHADYAPYEIHITRLQMNRSWHNEHQCFFNYLIGEASIPKTSIAGTETYGEPVENVSLNFSGASREKIEEELTDFQLSLQRQYPNSPSAQFVYPSEKVGYARLSLYTNSFCHIVLDENILNQIFEAIASNKIHGMELSVRFYFTFRRKDDIQSEKKGGNFLLPIEYGSETKGVITDIDLISHDIRASPAEEKKHVGYIDRIQKQILNLQDETSHQLILLRKFMLLGLCVMIAILVIGIAVR